MIKTKQLYDVQVKQSRYEPKAKTKKGYMFKKYSIYVYLGIIVVALYTFLFNLLILNDSMVTTIKSILAIMPELLPVFAMVGSMFTLIIMFVVSFGWFYQAFFLDTSIENYLAMPISGRAMVQSKLLFIIVKAMTTGYGIYIPVYTVLLYYGYFDMLQIILLMLVPFGLLVVALSIGSLFTLLVVSLGTRFKSKRLAQSLYYIILIGFGLIAYIFYVAGAGMVGGIFGETDMSNITEGIKEIVAFYQTYMGWLTVILEVIFAPVFAIFDAAYGRYVLYSVLFPSILALILYVYSKLYIRLYLGFNEIAVKSKTFEQKVLSRIKKKSITKVFMYKEIKEIFRTNAYFMQGLFSMVLMGILFSAMSTTGIVLGEVALPSNILWLMLLGAQFMILLFGSLSVLPATLISREGADQMAAIKAMPISGFKAMVAKLFGYYIVVAIILLTCINVPLIVGKVSLLTLVSTNIVVLITIPVTLFTGAVIDSMFVNFVWESPIALMKRSKNTFLNLFLELIMMCLIGFIDYLYIIGNDLGEIFEIIGAETSFDRIMSLIEPHLMTLFIINTVVVMVLTFALVMIFKVRVNKLFKTYE